MLTREEIEAIERECAEQHISQHEYLDSHGIARHQFYRLKRRYKEEDEQSLRKCLFGQPLFATSP